MCAPPQDARTAPRATAGDSAPGAAPRARPRRTRPAGRRSARTRTTWARSSVATTPPIIARMISASRLNVRRARLRDEAPLERPADRDEDDDRDDVLHRADRAPRAAPSSGIERTAWMSPPVTMLAVPIVSRTKPQKMPACISPARRSLNIFVWTNAYSIRPGEPRRDVRERARTGRRGPRRRPAGGGPSRARRTRPRPRRRGRPAGRPGRRRTARTVSGSAPSGRPRVAPWSNGPASVSSAWSRTGTIASSDSMAPFGLPGRLTTSVRPTTPTTPRDRSAIGVDRAALGAHRLGEPGTS